jgi:ATP-dependent helicase HrpB
LFLLLPVEDALPALRKALAERSAAVLVAPPGAGKSTRVPIALLEEPWAQDGKLVVLEPRRLAARAAAERMAATLGEPVGETVGLRMRLDSRTGPRTRVEVVTEGVFARMIVDDPGLDSVAAVLFDEFHERSLDADLGLALALDVQAALRPELRLLVMSATLEASRVAALLGDAPVVESAGRMHTVETRWLGRDPARPIEEQAAEAVRRALAEEAGSALVFLPGAREIRRVEARLAERVSPDVIVAPLYGALEFGAQRQAVAPAPAGRRKVVLATAIAETSLTIEGVRIVVDCGLSRTPRYDPATGLTRLDTVRAPQASAEQRRGRAGRIEPGVCYRLWDEASHRALPPHGRPEMLDADLAPLALALAEWGVSEPGALRWLDPPPRGHFAEANGLLRRLGALDGEGRITAQGRKLARLPMAPRLGHMLLAAAETGEGGLAARIATLLTERGLGGSDPDLRERLARFEADRSPRTRDARRLAAGWHRLGPFEPERAGAALALAYPDRIAKARPGRPGEFQLASGRGVRLEATGALAREPWLAVAEVADAEPQGRILLAAPIAPEDIERELAGAIEIEDELRFDVSSRTVRARRVRRLGRLELGVEPLEPAQTALHEALEQGLRGLGAEALPWTPSLRQWRARVKFLRRLEGEPWPELSDAAALDAAAPALAGKRSLDELTAEEFGAALRGLLPWPLLGRLDEEAPTHFTTVSGERLAVDYEAENGPALAARVQALFGQTSHPTIAHGRAPLLVHLLSPARRPVQATRDLPGFWRGSYKAVRAEMRGRYPKHPWPEDPAAAPPPARRR